MRVLSCEVFWNRDGNALIETAIKFPIRIIIMSDVINFMFTISSSMQSDRLSINVEELYMNSIISIADNNFGGCGRSPMTWARKIVSLVN